MVAAKKITDAMAGKAAMSGLREEHFRLAVRRGGEEGLTKLLLENVLGKPRVTKAKNTIKKIMEFYV